MALHTIKRGLKIPIKGAPAPNIDNGPAVSRVAVVAHDYPFMKARMAVNVGEPVKRGQLLFEDRKGEGVRFTAPGAGVVGAIHRGYRRALTSVVIELDSATQGLGEQVAFENYTGASIATLGADAVRALLSESGLWAALRMRPFSRVPSITEQCDAFFVTAMDTQPLAGSVAAVIEARRDDFAAGMAVLAKLTDGPRYVCTAPGQAIPEVDGFTTAEFKGKHPAGLVGTHIHQLAPVSRKATAWHVGYQDVLAIGKLFQTGIFDPERVVALGGPLVKNPRMLRTRIGACIDQLTESELLPDQEARVISGSVLSGRTSTGEDQCYLGRYHNQITCLAEDRERVFLGWLGAGFGKFSTIRAFGSAWLGGKKEFDFTTTTHGSHRAMVPIGMFERVLPPELDIMPTFLLRALLVDDVERAEALGALELDEEDLAICSFVSPGKEDYGKALRRNLEIIWKEG